MKRKFALLSLLSLIMGCFLFFGVSCGQNNGSDVGGTNIQVEGVDEGDFAKHVGDYLYLFEENGITVSLCKPNGEVSAVSSYHQSNVSPQEMFISNNRLIAFYTYDRLDENQIRKWSGLRIFDLQDLGEDYSFSDNILYSLDFKGEYRDSRIVIEKEKLLLCYRTKTTEQIWSKNESGAYDVRDTVLSYEINGESSVVGKPEELNNIPKYLFSDDITVYATIDLMNNSFSSKFKATTGFPFNTLYVSEYGFYTVYAYEEMKVDKRACGGWVRSIDHTMIARVDSETLEITAQKFFDSMYLISRQAIKDTGDTVFLAMIDTDYDAIMMLACDQKLNLVGYLSDICQGELLKSVSYVEEEDKLYCNLVSYKQQINLDPLFKIDITNPKDMRVCGLLSIDGYSDYLYDFDGGYTVGIGDDGTGNVKVSLFNTSKNYPIEVKSFTYSEDGGQSTSESTKNSHAFCVDRENNLFCIPIKKYNLYRDVVYSRLYFYKIDKEGEEPTLIELGYVESENGEDMRRAFFDETYIYAVSTKEIQSFLLADILVGRIQKIASIYVGIN